MTADDFTDKEQCDAAVRDLAQFPHGIDSITAWMSGSVWARNRLAAQEPDTAEEVRKAKAEAWDETCEAFAWCITNGPIEDALPYVAEHNPHRATETGDSDEHR